MFRRICRRLAVLSIALATVIEVGPAGSVAARAASPEFGPRLSVVVGAAVVQRATAYVGCWFASDSGPGVCFDGVHLYPRAVHITAPTRIAIRIHYPRRPRSWSVSAASRVKHHRYYDEALDSVPLRFHLVPHRARGSIRAWDAIVTLDQRNRNYFIDAGGSFDKGGAQYTLHLHT